VMAENSKIEWTDHTFNPWIGCTKVGPGCDHCYAERREDKRLHRVQWGPGQPRQRTKTWGDPVRWNKQHEAFFAEHGRRQRVFCASLADVFDNEVDPAWRAELFALIASTPNLDWLLLTKRIGNVAKMIEAPGMQKCGLPPNVWLGATVVNQVEADRDVSKLLAVPARVRFLSIEPMLGLINLLDLPASPKVWPHKHHLGENIECRRHMDALRGIVGWVGGVDPHEAPDEEGLPRLHWVICGGESGPGARAMHPDWARSLRDQCAAAGVPFLFKQWGEFLPASANEADPTVADVRDSLLFWSDGSKWDRFDGQRAGVDLVARVGKKAAGRRLDGAEHNGFPVL
jgi:protein gp37